MCLFYAEVIVNFPCTDHSFFGTEWQKRWCALSHNIFYYYGSEKGTFSSQLWILLCFCLPGFGSCLIWTINDDVLISCNQTSSRRGSSVSTATLSKWTTPYGKTQRKTAALTFTLQTSDSIKYARLTVTVRVIAAPCGYVINWKTNQAWDVPCLRLEKACVYMHFIKSPFFKKTYSLIWHCCLCHGST